MSYLKIIFLCVIAACGYGVIHDQFTIRICPEYFTVYHPPIFNNVTSLTLLAVFWGMAATWWVGLPLGFILAISARLGKWPKLTVKETMYSVLKLLCVMAIAAIISGFLGYHLTSSGKLVLPGRIVNGLDHTKHAAFAADWWAHNASYMVGMFGGIFLCCRVLIKRLVRSRHNDENICTGQRDWQ